MIDIVTNEHYDIITSLFDGATKRIRIISPFLSRKMADLLCGATSRGVECSFITRMYLQDFLDGSNTLDGLQDMLDAGVQLYALIGLHTKLYLFDEHDCIVGSANFTEGGLTRNIELSVHFKYEEDIQTKLDLYFKDLEKAIVRKEQGIISQEMLDSFKTQYASRKLEYGSLTGGVKVTTAVCGAALDTKARSIKDDPGVAFEEIQTFLGERNTDAVYGALGGERGHITHKALRNIILKFSASSKDRFDGNKPMDMIDIEEDGKHVYISNFSIASEKRAQTVEDLDETYFCVHSFDMMGNPSPMIVGKGFLRSYKSSNDARRKEWFGKYEWLAEYPFYCIIDEAEIINAPVKCGIPLREVTDALGSMAYMHTKDNPDKYTREKVAHSHRQQVMLSLTPEAKEYIDQRLRELGDEYGCIHYRSEA